MLRDGDRGYVTGNARSKTARLHCVAVRQMTKTAVGVRQSCCVAGTIFIIDRFVLRVIVVTEMLRGATCLVRTVSIHGCPRVLQRQNEEQE